MRLRPPLLGVFTVIALGVSAPAAMAGDFCVGVSLPRCPVATYNLNTTGLLTAEDAADADPGPDTVVIAPHVFDLAQPLNLVPASDTTIVGAGPGQTVFQGAYPGQDLLSISGAAGSAVSGFSVLVNDDSASGTGLSVTGATVSDFSVEKVEDFPSNSVGFKGLEIGDGATVHDATITIGTFAGVGIMADYKSATAYDIEVKTSLPVNSGTGIVAESSYAGTDLNFHHMKIKGFAAGVYVTDKKFSLTDSLIDLGPGTNILGVGASASGSNAIELKVARVTIVGRGTDQTAFSLYSDSAPASVDAELYDFLAYVPPANAGTFRTLYCAGGSGAPQPVNVDVEYFASWGGDYSVNPGCAWDLESDKTIAYVNDGEPQFRDFDNADYRLHWYSPLIDAGDTQASIADSDKDLAGAKRLVDGNGDDLAKPELGAYEYQRLAPQVTIHADKTTVGKGESVVFSATATDPEDEAITLNWDLGDGSTFLADDGPTHAYSAYGSYNAKVTAVDDTGASATSVITINVPDPPKPPVAAAPATAKVTVKPKKAFVAGKKGFSIAKKSQPSFTVEFGNATRAKFAVQRIEKRKLKKFQAIGSLGVTDGANRIFFGGGKLKPGKYRVKITPIAASGLAGKPVTTDIKLK